MKVFFFFPLRVGILSPLLRWFCIFSDFFNEKYLYKYLYLFLPKFDYRYLFPSPSNLFQQITTNCGLNFDSVFSAVSKTKIGFPYSLQLCRHFKVELRTKWPLMFQKLLPLQTPKQFDRKKNCSHKGWLFFSCKAFGIYSLIFPAALRLMSTAILQYRYLRMYVHSLHTVRV